MHRITKSLHPPHPFSASFRPLYQATGTSTGAPVATAGAKARRGANGGDAAGDP